MTCLFTFILEDNERLFNLSVNMNLEKEKCNKNKAILGVCFKMSTLYKNVILGLERKDNLHGRRL